MATITKEQMAALLNGREYGMEIMRDECALAKASGLVVVFGYSDDNMEVRGAWGEDEFGCNNGETWCVGPKGIVKEWRHVDHEDEDECDAYFKAKSTAKHTLTAIWSPKDLKCSWAYELDVPCATFDIVEDGELYCRGLVFAVADLAAPKTGAAQPTELIAAGEDILNAGTDQTKLTVAIARWSFAKQAALSGEKTPLQLIGAERERQITVKGWTREHDDRHQNHEIALMAAVYAMPASHRSPAIMRELCPWDDVQIKDPHTEEDRDRELVKAGALIVAELERRKRPVTQNGGAK